MTFSAPQQFLVTHCYSYYLPFFQPPWRLQLRDLSNPIVTFSNPNLDLGFSFLFRIAFRCTFKIVHLGMFRSLRQCPDHYSSLRHYPKPPRPIKTHQAYLGHLGSLGPLDIFNMTCMSCMVAWLVWLSFYYSYYTLIFLKSPF